MKHKTMYAVIRSINGMAWKYTTAEEIIIMHDGTVRIYSRDTDDAPVKDEITLHGPFSIAVIENSKEKAAH